MRAVLVTHLHGDHAYGLPGLLSTLQLTPGRACAADGTGPGLLVVGPRGLRALLARSVNFPLVPEDEDDNPVPAPAATSSPSPTPVRVVELAPGVAAAGALFGGATWHAVPVTHTPDVAAHAFVVREAARPPRLDAARAMSLGARGAQLGALQRGRDVGLADGRTVRAADVLRPRAPPRCVAVMGDHGAVSAREGAALAAAARPCALLVDECTFPDALGDVAAAGAHTTPRGAAGLAVRLGARTLALTHLSQRVVRVPRKPGDCTPETLAAQARAHLAEDAARVHVVVAEDFMEVVVPEVEDPQEDAGGKTEIAP